MKKMTTFKRKLGKESSLVEDYNKLLQNPNK